jgi:peroxiredoxin
MKTSIKLMLVAMLSLAFLIGCEDRTVQEQDQPAQVIGPCQPAETSLDFTLTDHNGNAHSLSDYTGKIIVLEWVNPDCPFVKRHYEAGTMAATSEKYADEDVVWLAINSSNYADQDFNKAFAQQYDIDYPVLDDSSGEVGLLYGAKTTPHMFIVDKSGDIVYNGAIDNNPSGDKTDVINYVDAALGELLAEEQVSTPETTPYGCTVKYKE